MFDNSLLELTAVSIIKAAETGSTAFLFRNSHGKFCLIWKDSGYKIEVPVMISRKFIRENLVDINNVDNILFDLDSSKKNWINISKKIIDGVIEVVSVDKMLKE